MYGENPNGKWTSRTVEVYLPSRLGQLRLRATQIQRGERSREVKGTVVRRIESSARWMIGAVFEKGRRPKPAHPIAVWVKRAQTARILRSNSLERSFQ